MFFQKQKQKKDQQHQGSACLYTAVLQLCQAQEEKLNGSC